MTTEDLASQTSAKVIMGYYVETVLYKAAMTTCGVVKKTVLYKDNITDNVHKNVYYISCMHSAELVLTAHDKYINTINK